MTRISMRLLLAVSITVNIVLFITLLSEPFARFRYPFLSPRIFALEPNDTIINFVDLRTQLNDFVNRQTQFSRSSVYFEYLPSGVSIGVNASQNYVTASLLKVPFVMGVYKLIEQGSLRHDQTLTIQGGDLDPGFGDLWKRGTGATLSVDGAVNLALTRSDNTAARVLDGVVSDDLVRDVYDALDVPVDINANLPLVSAKNFSSIFRCLYLSCYLSYGSSQRILETLTQTIFTDGLPAGVPAGVPVAHKIGVYDAPSTGDRIRSDCGIVYVPKRPYMVCALVETDKAHESLAPQFFKQLNQRVYEYVTAAD